MHTFVHVHVYIHTYTHAHSYRHACIFSYMHTHVIYAYTLAPI